MKELFISLIVPQAKRRLVTPQRPKVVKQIIFSCRILPEGPLAVQNITQHRPSGRKRCFLCPRSKDKKYRLTPAVNVITPLAKNTARWSVIGVRSKIFVHCALHYIFQAINTD